MLPSYHPQSEAIRARIDDRQREALRLRADARELIVGTRRALAQSRLLIAEADALIDRTKPSGPGLSPQSVIIPK